MSPPSTDTSRADGPFRRRVPARTLLGVAIGSLALACDFEPKASSLEYTLNDRPGKTLDMLSEATDNPDALAAQISGALEMLFGTPSAPQYLILEDWADEDFDPNLGGAAELDDEAFEQVKEQNRRRFKRQLELLVAGEFTAIPEPRAAADLWREWEDRVLPELLEDPDALVDPDDEELGSWTDEADYLFSGWYPTLAESAELYRQQCLHCHGVDGGGDGPTSEYLDPRPRDYREGKFKWVAVDRNKRPRRADLLRILELGVSGTAMPSFARFSRGELEGLVDYVRLLSMRGEVESFLAAAAADEGYLPASSILESYELVWSKWDEAEENYKPVDGKVPRPSDVTAEMLEHGRDLFLGDVANCYTCHGTDGRGNGASVWEADPSGLTEIDEEGNEVPVMRVRLDEWGNESNPRNFRNAVFRGGSRPIDFYRRIKYGISGTIMPAADASLTDDDIWALAYHVLSIAEEYDVARSAERKTALMLSEHGHEHESEEVAH